jgi:hypothetical protein
MRERVNLSKSRRALQRASRVTVEAMEARVLLSGATDISLLSNGNLLINDSGSVNDALTISRNGANVRVTDPGNSLAAGSGANQVDAHTVDVPLASISGNIQVDTGDGDDTLTIDTSDGLVAPIAFDGGAGFDTLRFTGTSLLDSQTYNYGSDASSGSIDLAAGGVTQTVQYTHIEPIQDSVPVANFTVNGTAADNAINYTQGPGGGSFVGNTGLISVDVQETLEFNNKTNLVINGLAGSDTINLHYNNVTNPAGLTGTITVDGGDPTASDTPYRQRHLGLARQPPLSAHRSRRRHGPQRQSATAACDLHRHRTSENGHSAGRRGRRPPRGHRRQRRLRVSPWTHQRQRYGNWHNGPE